MAWNGQQWPNTSNLSTSGMMMPAGMEHLTVEQQQVMMQQNWQQWQSYYQQYAQWQAQYGQQYQQELNKLQPPLPDHQPPPPPPPAPDSGDGKPQPPLPPSSGENASTGPAPRQQQQQQQKSMQQQNNNNNNRRNNQNFQGPPENHQNFGFDGPSDQFDQQQHVGGGRGRGRGRGRGDGNFDGPNDRRRNPMNNMGDLQNNNNNNRFQNQRQFGDNQGAGNHNMMQGRGRGGRGNRGGGRFNNNPNWQQQHPNNNHQGGGGNRDNHNFNQQNFHHQHQDHYDDFTQDYDGPDQFQEQFHEQDQFEQFPNNQNFRPSGPNQINNRNNNNNHHHQHHQHHSNQQYHGGNHGQPQTHSHQQQQQQPQENYPPNDVIQQTAPTQDQQKQWDKEDDEDERVFDEQFRKWEDQFNHWKMQNQDHPDRNSYTRYEREFEDVRIRLMERRDQMRQRRLSARQEILRSQGGQSGANQGQNQQQNRQQGPTAHQFSQQQQQLPPPPPPPESEAPKSHREENRERDEDCGASNDKSYNVSDENVDDFFERRGSGGIPGLDLVEPQREKEFIDGEEVINLEEEESAAKKAAEADRDREIKEGKREGLTKEPEFTVDEQNINNILQNPNIMSLLSQVKGNVAENSTPIPQPIVVPSASSALPPNVNDLLQNANIQEVLNSLNNHQQHQQQPQPLPPPQEPNINALLQNPKISNLLNQVQSGLMGNQHQQHQHQHNQPPQPIWNNPPGNFPDRQFGTNRTPFDCDLPPAFRGNPEALGLEMAGGRGGGGVFPFGQNMGGNPQFCGPPPAVVQGFSGPPPSINHTRDYNLLPPPVIHGGRKPESSTWDRSVGDFGQRRPVMPVADILVPTKVVDYQHRSVTEKLTPLDYFHRKDQSDPKPQPLPMKSRNIFTSRWSAPKRQSRFSEEVAEPKRQRPGEDEGRNRRVSWTENLDRNRRDGGRNDTARGGDRKVAAITAGGKDESKSKTSGGQMAEDYLEGISDEEIDNTAPVDMEEDNYSLSSVEDLPDVPMAKQAANETRLFGGSVDQQGEANLISIEKLLLNPGRKRRPRRILIVIRGLPGSGKTHIAKLIKDKEVEMGGSAPRILSIDDYFTTETDEISTCPVTGKDINLKSMVYEYEKEMEEKYLQYLLKAFKKTISDGYFDFIVVDAVYPKMSSVLEITSHAKEKGFVSYICSLDSDVAKCVQQNVHNRTEDELIAIAEIWEPCPDAQLRLDIQPLIEWSQIPEIPVEDISNDEFDDVDMEEGSVKKESPPQGTEVVKGTGERKEETAAQEGKGTELKEEQPREGDNCTGIEVSNVVAEAAKGENESDNVKVEVSPETKAGEKEEGNANDAGESKVPESQQDKAEEKVSYNDVINKEAAEAEEEAVAEEEQVDLEAQLQEELETNFEDVDGDGPVDEEEDTEPEPIDESLFASKWDSDPKEDRLAKMDGISKPLRAPTIEEYLQTDEYLQTFEEVEPGKKRVRWADIEEKKAQDKMRAIGFVVGQTDWTRMMDPTEGQGALTKTKYIDRVRKDDPS